MSIVHRYINTRPCTNFIFKDGKFAHFVLGEAFNCYDTDVETEIQQLDAEVANKNPHIKKLSTYDSDAPSPLEMMKSKMELEIRAKIKAEQDAALNPANDRGNSTPGKLNLQTSAGVASGAGESTSSDTAPVNATSEAAATASKVTLSGNAVAALSKLNK